MLKFLFLELNIGVHFFICLYKSWGLGIDRVDLTKMTWTFLCHFLISQKLAVVSAQLNMATSLRLLSCFVADYYSNNKFITLVQLDRHLKFMLLQLKSHQIERLEAELTCLSHNIDFLVHTLQSIQSWSTCSTHYMLVFHPEVKQDKRVNRDVVDLSDITTGLRGSMHHRCMNSEV